MFLFYFRALGYSEMFFKTSRISWIWKDIKVIVMDGILKGFSFLMNYWLVMTLFALFFPKFQFYLIG